MSASTQNKLNHFARTRGEVYVWLSSMGLVIGLVMILALLGLIFSQGLSVFWPKKIAELTLSPDSSYRMGDTDKISGRIVLKQQKRGLQFDAEPIEEWQINTANRDAYGASFKYLNAADVRSVDYPPRIAAVERMEYGDAIGFPKKLSLDGGKEVLEESDPSFEKQFARAVKTAEERRHKLGQIEKYEIGRINSRLTALANRQRILAASGDSDSSEVASLQKSIDSLQAQFQKLAAEARDIRTLLTRDVLTLQLSSGQERQIEVGSIVHVTFPNALSFAGKVELFFYNFWTFLSANPREANMEGGIFPAIFGTAVMTILMSIAVMPFGVIAAIYLREYAKDGFLVRSVRIAVNNLAGVPSIVFGVFGLGFFVYFAGGTIDQLFFSETLPTPTFGTGGIFWASMTLAIMTVPVVIVATEESLAAVPRGVREGSLACGASKWQTIQRVVLPAAAPGILTGLILAMARGAGEVAPLMLVGVVKLAPSLPIDGQFPFVHLERKFMHLGFHIFDLGFQSPDAEAAKPMVFATTLLLILLVVILNLAAIIIRERLRKKYATGAF